MLAEVDSNVHSVMAPAKAGAEEIASKAASAKSFFIFQQVLLLSFGPTRLIQILVVDKRKGEHPKVIHNFLKRFVEIVQTGSTDGD